MGRLASLVLAASTALLLLAAPARALELKVRDAEGKIQGAFVTAELHASLLSEAVDWSMLAGSFGYAIKGGLRFDNFGVFLQFEQNLWIATELEREVVRGAFNIGVGGEIIYADGFVRTSLALGPSILAYDEILDDAGTTGFFADLRPVGLRFVVHEYLVIGLDPISFAVVAPVLGGIPIIKAEYRTELYLECAF